MASRPSFLPRFACLATALTVLAALLVTAAPAQADHDDDHILSVSSWCGQTVRFTNLSSDEVDVYWEIVAPLSPFSAKVGDFSLDPRESYTLNAIGGLEGGPAHRLYYKAESDDHDQEGYVDQWKYCKTPLVKTYVECGYVTFTNVFNHRVKVRYQQGHDYGDWDDDFLLFVGRSKKIEFDEKVLWFSAESRWDDNYRRQVGTIYQPEQCEEYKKHDDDDDDDDEWELHDAGDFILKIIPFSDGPLLDTSTFGGLFRR
ncbi:MAG: hypothetical protein ACRDOT_02660 [Aeromicrobium sp.]